MIRLQGQYRLTFPITPAEISFRGFGSEIETQTSITLESRHQLSSLRPKAISFEFVLPGNLQSELIEVEGYQGPRPWLQGLERLTGKPVLVTIDELDLAWNVLVGPCDGKFTGIHADFTGSIELPLFIKEEFVTWTNAKQLLIPGTIVSKQVKQRPNTTGKVTKKQEQQHTFYSIYDEQKQAQQRREIEKVIENYNRTHRGVQM